MPVLGVFKVDKDKLEVGPDSFANPIRSAMADDYLEDFFCSSFHSPSIFRWENHAIMAMSDYKRRNLDSSSRSLMSEREMIYRMYQVEIDDGVEEFNNLSNILNAIVKENQGIEFNELFPVYKPLAGRNQSILYDNREGIVKSVLALNCLGNKSMWYGIDSEDKCVITDYRSIIKKVCGQSVKRIPPGTGIRFPVLPAPPELAKGIMYFRGSISDALALATNCCRSSC